MTTGEPTEPMLEAAADWLLRLQGAPADSSIRAAHARWRAADPRHERAWARMEMGWTLIGEAVPRRPSPMVMPFARKRMTLRLGLGMAVAACLLLLFVPRFIPRLLSDHVTATAELRQLTLEDGSVVELGPRTAFDVHFTVGRRGVTLSAGEAFFEVAPDAQRPFAIRVGDVDVTVVGTSFNVGLTASTLSIAVRSGVVDVHDRHSGAPALRLGAGDRVRIDRTSHAVLRDSIAPEEIGAWRDRRLFVEGATVAEVAEEIGRYRPGWVVVASGRLGSQRVTGLFELQDPDRALNALVRPFNGESLQISPYLRILSGP